MADSRPRALARRIWPPPSHSPRLIHRFRSLRFGINRLDGRGQICSTFVPSSQPTRPRVHDLSPDRRLRRHARLPARGARRGPGRAGVPSAFDLDRPHARVRRPPPRGRGGLRAAGDDRGALRRARPVERRTRRPGRRHGGMAGRPPDRSRPRRRRPARFGRPAARGGAREPGADDGRELGSPQRAACGDRTPPRRG